MHAIVCFIFAVLAAAQDGTQTLPTFGDVIPIPGAMERFDQDFADGLALDLFSPTNRTVVVNQNLQPLGGQFVTGSSGETFVALKNYSYVIKTSDNALDLVAKIEVPYDLDMLNQMGLQESNTYVGKLADDKMSWTVDEATRNVHRSENNTRIIKMTSIDGEYILLGRQSIDTTNIFVQYGQGATRTVNITAGGRQEAEFIDGLRFSVVAQQDMKINVDLKNGVDPATLPSGTQSLNSYSWVVNTTAASANMSATMKVPFNRQVLARLLPAGSSSNTTLSVARRPLDTGSPFEVACDIKQQVMNGAPDDRIMVSQLSSLDGEYVILVPSAQ
ncbi:hypothetical protein BJ166DRAFT_582462 [Pestalotiopsis sp. NC0098]|nr:hypothetical protein BJ166DRAFT_582462 [Pestalotiopsis sp. NC0098]